MVLKVFIFHFKLKIDLFDVVEGTGGRQFNKVIFGLVW
jgi:hypothetical protein